MMRKSWLYVGLTALFELFWVFGLMLRVSGGIGVLL